MKDTSPYIVKVDEHITLRIRTAQDAKDVFALVQKNRKRLAPWMFWLKDTKTVADSKAFIAAELKKFKENTGCDFGIYYDEVLVGSGGFNKIDMVNSKGAIGYWISEEYEGKGIMTKVVQKMLDIGKKKYRLHRIEITMNPDNIRSQAIPKRLGFEYEGTLREAVKVNGKFFDSEMWSLILK